MLDDEEWVLGSPLRSALPAVGWIDNRMEGGDGNYSLEIIVHTLVNH